MVALRLPNLETNDGIISPFAKVKSQLVSSKLTTECLSSDASAFEYSMENKKVVTIANNSFITVFKINWNSCSQLSRLIIGDNCFTNVEVFAIDELNELESIIIGEKSFTTAKNGYDGIETRSFHITNCTKLETLKIGPHSFSDYKGFELASKNKLNESR